MRHAITISAPAKINLHLQVFPKREDGFHDLRSLFVMVSLYDELRIVQASHGGCEVSGFSGIPLRENLIWKAYSFYVKEFGEDAGIDVYCGKQIPPMSGLGGGSSDAAALLKGLQLLRKRLGLPVPDSRKVEELAGTLGSDVPFFLGHSAALVEGRGDRLEPISMGKEYDLVLIRPDIDVPTGEAYQRLDLYADTTEVVHERELSAARIVEEFTEFLPEKWNFFNSFTSVLGIHYPQIESLIKGLYLKGASYANLSGSGSAVYGVFPREESALAAVNFFKKTLKNVWKLKMLASVPEAVYNKLD